MSMNITDLINAYEDYEDKTEWVPLVNEFVVENEVNLEKRYLKSEIFCKEHKDILASLKAKVRYKEGEIFHPTRESNKVFVVHGHDIGLLEKAQQIIKETGYEPIVLSEQANNGKTIIEKLEDNIKDVFCAVVLHSSCDEATNNNTTIKQSRPNVIFEHGLLEGRLGRNKIIIVKGDEEVTMPSDLQGRVYIEDKDLAKELKSIKK